MIIQIHRYVKYLIPIVVMVKINTKCYPAGRVQVNAQANTTNLLFITQ